MRRRLVKVDDLIFEVPLPTDGILHGTYNIQQNDNTLPGCILNFKNNNLHGMCYILYDHFQVELFYVDDILIMKQNEDGISYYEKDVDDLYESNIDISGRHVGEFSKGNTIYTKRIFPNSNIRYITPHYYTELWGDLPSMLWWNFITPRLSQKLKLNRFGFRMQH